MFDAPQPFGQKLMNGGYETVRYGSDEGLFVKFRMEAVRNNYQSDLEGREVHDQVPYVFIQHAGSRDTFDGEATDAHKQRFPKQWEAFERGQADAPQGTAVESAPWLNVAQVATLKANSILTIEQLAALPEPGLEALGPGARKMQENAQRFLNASERLQPIAELEAKNNELNSQVEALKKQLSDINERLGTEPRKKRGRPKKINVDEGETNNEKESNDVTSLRFGEGSTEG